VVEKSSTDPAVSGFVLAGGKSLRMGRDKATLEFRGIPFLDHMVRLLSTVASSVRIVGKDDLPDKIPGCGPLGGIRTALDVTVSDLNLIVAVDLPLLTPAFLAWFCARMAGSKGPLVACRIGSNFPLCLGVNRSLGPQVADRIDAGNLALHRFIRDMDSNILAEAEIHSAGFPSSIFQNFNTPDDWKTL